MLFFAVTLVVAVAAFALFSDLSLVAATKRRELGVLAALGADAGTIRAAFLWLGLLIGGLGTGLGAAFGALTAELLDRTHALSLPAGVLLFDYLPFEVGTADVLIVVATALGLSGLCSALAADRVARLDPVMALRR